MSFTSPFSSFGPLPTPPTAPLRGLADLEAAIRRLEATIIPTPASAVAGAARSGSACNAAVPGGQTLGCRSASLLAGPAWRAPHPTPVGGDAGATRPHTPHDSKEAGRTASPAWLRAASLLEQIDPDARPYLRRLFERALEAVQDDLALPPQRRRIVPVSFLVQHWGRPRFQTDQPREQAQHELDRLLRHALWRALDALEAAVLLPGEPIYQTILAEQCAQLGRVYEELKRRAGRCVALLILQGELRMVHHRGSSAVEQMLFR